MIDNWKKILSPHQEDRNKANLEEDEGKLQSRWLNKSHINKYFYKRYTSKNVLLVWFLKWNKDTNLKYSSYLRNLKTDDLRVTGILLTVKY